MAPRKAVDSGDSVQARVDLGVVLLERGEFNEAEALLRKAIAQSDAGSEVTTQRANPPRKPMVIPEKPPVSSYEREDI